MIVAIIPIKIAYVGVSLLKPVINFISMSQLPAINLIEKPYLKYRWTYNMIIFSFPLDLSSTLKILYATSMPLKTKNVSTANVELITVRTVQSS